MGSNTAALTESVDGSDRPGGALPQAVEAGTVIGERYEIIRTLGSGGYAIVYLAHDRRLDTDVALKVLRADRASAAALARFRREVAIAREAISPNLVRVYDIGSDGEASYLTMEAVAGESLRDRMRRGPVPVDEAVAITAGVLEGLTALHALNVIHRDVKPENILLDRNGVPKLADFGLARMLDDARAATATGAIVGTTDYLSPEQALGKPVDPRGDLYALGVVLFEMLAGRVPFDGDSAVSNVIARLRAPAPSLRDFRGDVPLWLTSIVARLLEKEPARRYASAEDASSALQRRKVDVRAMVSRRLVIAGAIAAALMSAAIILPSRHSPPTFVRVDGDGARGIAGVGSHGEVLWRIAGTRPDTVYAKARLEAGGAPVLAMVLIRGNDFLPKDRETLSFIEPETGKILRQVKLPSAGAEFPACTDRFTVRGIAAEDLDGDGVDEIIVGYNHIPEAPTYIVLYEPRVNRARVIFEAIGHHRYVTARDLDGDGRKELIISGINNGVNWYNGMAAMRLNPPVNDPTPEALLSGAGPVRAPDMFNRAEPDLVWYTLLPRGLLPVASSGYHFDQRRRAISVIYGSRPPVEVSYDGFLLTDASPLPAAERAQYRREAWSRFQRTQKLVGEDFGQNAVEEAQRSVDDASRASDSLLVEVMRSSHARALIAAGRIPEAEAEFNQLTARSENAMELAYDAGRAFHLHGDLELAVNWYRRGLSSGNDVGLGKGKNEYIQGIVLALCERREWIRAVDAVDHFHQTYPAFPDETLAFYRAFIRWRSGATPNTDGLANAPAATDVRRYWLLEFRNARGENPQMLMNDVEREIAWHAEPLGPLWSLEAALLARVGRPADAANAARRAADICTADSQLNVIARGHLPLVRERLAHYAGEAH